MLIQVWYRARSVPSDKSRRLNKNEAFYILAPSRGFTDSETGSGTTHLLRSALPEGQECAHEDIQISAGELTGVTQGKRPGTHLSENAVHSEAPVESKIVNLKTAGRMRNKGWLR